MSALSVHPNRSTRGQPPRRRSKDHMQVSVESTGNLERRLNFSLPAEQLEAGVSGRLREIARTARIKGFRPGKVPAKVIEQRFGDQVRAEVLGALVRQSCAWPAPRASTAPPRTAWTSSPPSRWCRTSARST